MPSGLEFDGVCLKGVPAATGVFKALVQPLFGGEAGGPIELNFSVAEGALAYGSFTAVIKEISDSVDQRMLRLGLLTFTAGADGAMSAKAKIGASNYGFSSKNGYDSVIWSDVSAPGFTRRMSLEMSTPMTIGEETYINTLKLTVGDGSLTNLTALGECVGTVELTMNIIGSDGDVREEVVYAGELIRNNSDSDAFRNVLADYVGYYTVALVPETTVMADGVPAGNGYLMFTVKDDGVATGSGRLSDGTAYSYSAPVALRGDLADPATVKLVVPVFAKTNPYSFGGLLEFAGSDTVDSRSIVEWNKDGSKSSYDGLGFTIDVRPTGGLYNTVENLQRYYLDYDFEAGAEPVNGLPGELLPAGQDYSLDTLPHGVSVSLDGDSITVPSRVFKMDAEKPKKIDFDASVNAWKLRVGLNRVTGLVSGSFQAFSDGENSSASFGTFEHFGVLLMNRDGVSPLDADVWSAGAALMPVTDDWTLSIPFNIKTVKVDRDWSETEIPATE